MASNPNPYPTPEGKALPSPKRLLGVRGRVRVRAKVRVRVGVRARSDAKLRYGVRTWVRAWARAEQSRWNMQETTKSWNDTLLWVMLIVADSGVLGFAIGLESIRATFMVGLWSVRFGVRFREC